MPEHFRPVFPLVRTRRLRAFCGRNKHNAPKHNTPAEFYKSEFDVGEFDMRELTWGWIFGLADRSFNI